MKWSARAPISNRSSRRARSCCRRRSLGNDSSPALDRPGASPPEGGGPSSARRDRMRSARGGWAMVRQWRKALVLLALIACLATAPAFPVSAALGEEPRPGETVTQYLTAEILPVVFPGADRIGPV